MIKSNSGGIKTVRFLTESDMQKIHAQALYLLENTGIGIEHTAGMAVLEKAGATMDYDKQTARIPEALVEKCLASVPRKITLAGRNPERDLILEPGGTMRTRNTGGMTQIHDLETGEIRESVLSDTADFARLLDGLDDIDFIAPLYAADVPLEILELQVLETMMSNTDKHINIRALDKRTFPYLIKMAEIVAGGKEALKERPVISILEAPISPLVFPDVFIESLLLGGEAGIPIEICSMPNVGGTGPITLAGSLLLSAVEHLATIVISQSACPGAPLIWASRFPALDMKSGNTGMLTEGALVSAAAAQLATEHYNLICDLHGPATNAVNPEGESVFEECIGAFVTGFAGRPAVLCGAGGMELGIAASFEQLVISNEIYAVLRRILDGFVIDDDTLGKDVIAQVGIGGNYLGEQHTIDHLRSERLNSALLRPKTRAKWLEEGSKSLVDLAREKARSILAEHKPAPMDAAILASLKELVQTAQKEFNA
jgi:trimethylamine--corrinoid protein Co-methyltransferase